jgi:hypothetical protein
MMRHLTLLTVLFVAILDCACVCAQPEAPRGMRPPEPIVLFDLTHLGTLDLSDPGQRRRLWDETHLVVSLQGLVNRDAPRLYVRCLPEPDDFWWQRMTEDGAWLADRKVETIRSLDELLLRFRSYYRGAVVWDERVPATSNLASTIAGCDSLLCLRYDDAPDSLYRKLIEGPVPLAIGVRLLGDDRSPLFTGKGLIPGTRIDSTGSAKCDAYRWLVEHYVRTGKTDPLRLGYYLDAFWLRCYAAIAPQNHTLMNHDFVIARRGLVFDLNVWDDEACVDDPGQAPGTDAATLKAILRATYERGDGRACIHAAGFVPWAYKYTDFKSSVWAAGGRHEAVATEWKYAEILSCYNAFMDADAIGLGAMANASFYQHYPLAKRYSQNPKPTRENLQSRGLLDAKGLIVPRRYVAHYVGDYDAAAWLYHQLPRMWNDPARGTTPLSWAFNPNLCERFPLGMAWAWEHRTANDFFVAGDSGAGYLNPGLLTPPRPHSGLGSGMAAWERHCQRFFSRWDITLTGFVIDGFGPGLAPEGLDAYARFSPDGIVAQKIGVQGVHQGMPYLRMRGDLPADPREAARLLRNGTSGPVPNFSAFRSILQTPTWYSTVERELKQIAGDEVQVVDLYTLLWLVREYETHRTQYARDQFDQAKEVSVRPGRSDGLDVVYVEDGRFTIEQGGNASWWLLPASPKAQYLYLDVAPSFYRSGQGGLEIEIEYLDAGPLQFGLEYDSTDASAAFGGAYKSHPQVVRAERTGAWRKAAFRVADARFQGAQNGAADFRFYYMGGPFQVRGVVVRRTTTDRPG